MPKKDKIMATKTKKMKGAIAVFELVRYMLTISAFNNLVKATKKGENK